MTIAELRAEMAPIAEDLKRRADEAEVDDFAPWVVNCLRRAAAHATLSDQVLRESQNSIEHEAFLAGRSHDAAPPARRV